MNIDQLNEIKEKHLKELLFRYNKTKIGDLPYRYEVMICCTTSCRSNNSLAMFDRFCEQIKAKGIEKKVRMNKTGCFGFCAKGPIAVVYPEGIFYSQLTEEKIDRIVEEHLLNDKPVEEFLLKDSEGNVTPTMKEIPFYKKQFFLAMSNGGYINPESIEDYIAADGYSALFKCLKEMTPTQVIETVKESGLQGRGGAGFSTGLKWELTSKNEADQKYVVCNADEGDPGAFMDRAIIERNPHCIVEAMAICGYAIGASRGYVYLRAEYPLAGEILEKAIKDAYDKGLLGKNIFGLGFNFDLSIKYGSGAFVCGEETALLSSTEGHRGEPKTKPPYPAVKGLFGKPTCINNVETFANISHIILKGAKWFSSIGSEKCKGTKVFALSGKINSIGICELPMGAKIRDVVYDIGGGIPNGREFKAVQMGGPSGGCIPKEYLDTPIDYKSLQELGSMMGSGGMIVVDEDTCMVNFAKFFLEFICEESCGKCTPCRIGNKRLLEILTRITEGKGKMSDIEELEELGNYIKQNSLCGLGQSSPNPVLSTLRYFKDEYIEHIRDHKCRAGVCKALTEFHIDEEKCKGCSACSRVCPVGAISGEIGKKFHIDQSKCIKCGTCIKTCRFGAIYKGAEK